MTLGYYLKPGTQQVQALADILRSALCCHSNKTRPPIPNPPNSAQPAGTPYIRVHTVVQECREGQTDRQIADGRDQYTSRLSYTS